MGGNSNDQIKDYSFRDTENGYRECNFTINTEQEFQINGKIR